MQQTFKFKKNVQIIRFTDTDAKRLTDRFQVFQDLILQNETMYPGIDSWMRNKVIPGLRSRERVAFICYQDEQPVATAIVKRGESAKFCHLKIDEAFQEQHLGEMLFSLMALELGQLTKEIHFTLPEGLWEKRKKFFHSFGFIKITKVGYKYRTSECELLCSAPFTEVWRSVQEKLPKLVSHFYLDELSMDNTLIMSIKPHFALQILNGSKTIEVRRKFSRRWVGHRVSLYASSPVKSIMGEATIAAVDSSDPHAIWEEYGHLMRCTREEYLSYTDSAKEVFAIQLDNVIPYKQDVSLNIISDIIGEKLIPPQSYYAIKPDTKWSKATTLSTILQNMEESRQSTFT